MQAPTLALPDYEKPFDLYVTTKKRYMTAILMQETYVGKRKQAVAYNSAKLDGVASAFPPCYQDLAGIWEAYQKAVLVTMGYLVRIYTHHKIVEMLDQAKFVLTPARIHNYQMLLTYPDITVVKCDTVNPAEYVPLPGDGTPHECVPESKEFMKLRDDLKTEPLQQEDKRIVFVDGSSYLDHRGIHAGYAVVEKRGAEWVTLEAERCPQPCSAQLAELKALTRVCELMAGQDAEIYTDSAYAHGVCHFFGSSVGKPEVF